MKTCLRLTLFVCLILPLSAAAQEKSVQVPYSCGAGEAFTISIPVKLKGMSGEYEWYKNGALIAGTRTALTAGTVAVIAYTIPAEEAYGDSVAFHFKYRLDDGCEEWTSSPKYVITFLSCLPPQASAVTGSTEVCANTTGHTYSVTKVSGVTYDWTLPAGWIKTAGGNTNSITVATGTTSGIISVTPANSCGSGTIRTLAVTANAPTAPTTVDYSCNNNQTATFTASGSTGGNGALSYLWSTVNTPNSGTWNALTTTKVLTATSTNHYMVAQDANGCRSTVSSAVAASLPAQPSAITGEPLVCASIANPKPYFVTSVANTTYSWTLPSGWTKTAGGTTSSIRVTAGTVNGNISVTPTRKGCVGTTARTLAVRTITCSAVNTTTCNNGITPGAYEVTTCSGVSDAGGISISETISNE